MQCGRSTSLRSWSSPTPTCALGAAARGVPCRMSARCPPPGLHHGMPLSIDFFLTSWLVWTFIKTRPLHLISGKHQQYSVMLLLLLHFCHHKTQWPDLRTQWTEQQRLALHSNSGLLLKWGTQSLMHLMADSPSSARDWGDCCTCWGPQVHGLVERWHISGAGRCAGQLLQHHCCQVVYEGLVCVQRWYAAPLLQDKQ